MLPLRAGFGSIENDHGIVLLPITYDIPYVNATFRYRITSLVDRWVAYRRPELIDTAACEYFGIELLEADSAEPPALLAAVENGQEREGQSTS